MEIVRLIGRLTIGALFIGHGTQKLFGWFGGQGLDGTEQYMKSLKLYPPRQQALMAGLTEAGGGALVAAGLCTPLGTAAITGAMATAIGDAHWPKGLWSYNGGYEYNLVLITSLAAITEDGPGRLSLDHALGIERRGTRWAVGAVALGVLGAMVNTTVSRKLAKQADQHAMPDEQSPATSTTTAETTPGTTPGTT